MLRTQGIILKKQNIGEADRLLTIFTRKMGKVRAKAIGVRKVTSKMAGHLDTLCLSQLDFFQGKNLPIVTDAKLIQPFLKIRKDYNKTSLALKMAKILEKQTGEGESQPKVFNLFKKTLEFLDNLNLIQLSKSTLLASFFSLNLLSLLGWKPEVSFCLSCQRILKEDKKVYFSTKQGGVLCQDCFKGQGKEIALKTLRVLKILLEGKLPKKSSPKITSEVTKITKQLLESHL